MKAWRATQAMLRGGRAGGYSCLRGGRLAYTCIDRPFPDAHGPHHITSTPKVAARGTPPQPPLPAPLHEGCLVTPPLKLRRQHDTPPQRIESLSGMLSERDAEAAALRRQLDERAAAAAAKDTQVRGAPALVGRYCAALM